MKINAKMKTYRELLKEKRSKLLSNPQKRKLVLKWACGEILELGCGEYQIFKNSTKVDIYPIKGCIVADCNKKLPINKKFDSIIAIDLIEHLSNVNTFLNECNRLLKINGNLIISTPNKNYWKARIHKLLGMGYNFNDPTHLHFFSPNELSLELKKHKFKIEKMTSLGRIRLLNFCGAFICLSKKLKNSGTGKFKKRDDLK